LPNFEIKNNNSTTGYSPQKKIVWIFAKNVTPTKTFSHFFGRNPPKKQGLGSLDFEGLLV
jgi:hypothetical protein